MNKKSLKQNKTTQKHKASPKQKIITKKHKATPRSPHTQTYLVVTVPLTPFNTSITPQTDPMRKRETKPITMQKIIQNTKIKF
jgi:hypothetical protein